MRNIDNKNPEIQKNKKSKVSFSKLLNVRKPLPTKKQIETWENDGGQINSLEKEVIIINGKKCDTLMQVLSARIKKFFKNRSESLALLNNEL